MWGAVNAGYEFVKRGDGPPPPAAGGTADTDSQE
jgi:hypothetical protein